MHVADSNVDREADAECPSSEGASRYFGAGDRAICIVLWLIGWSVRG
jgi:hypothetical protein